MACDKPKPSKFLSFDSCKKRFLWAHEEVDLVPHQAFGLSFQVGDVKMFPQALGFESQGSILRVSNQSRCFTATEKDGGDKETCTP